MTRHLLDRPRKPAPSRARTYLETDRQAGLHPATHSLIRRPRSAMQARIRHFIAIARAQDRTA